VPRHPVTIRQAADGSQWITTREVTQNIFGSGKRTQADVNRRHFGADIAPETIECAIRNAECGYMRDLADLSKESLNFDPHLISCVSKRFRALASIRPKFTTAEGPGVDPAKAQKFTEIVRQQVNRIPHFRQQVMRLNWGHFNGRAALEKLWRERTGMGLEYKFELSELNWLHARRLAFGPEREVRVRDDAFGGVAFESRGLPLEGPDAIPHKFICYKPQLFDEFAEREGFGPRAIYWSFFKRFSWRQRMILIEIFGNPWRIMEMEKGSPYTDASVLDDLQDRAEELGDTSSAALPPGVKLNLVNADPKSIDFHHITSQDCDDQMSKLVLGSTSTTDAKPAGLGSNQANVHQDSEALVIAADGWCIGDCLTEGLSHSIIGLNFGESEIINAPTIELIYERAPDQTIETDRATKVFAMGIPLKVEEVYRRTGWEKPEPGDEVLMQEVQGSGVPGVPPTTTAKPSIIGDPNTPPEPLAGGADGAAPAIPLARATARSLRLSRLSRDYFSGR
jgi:phage gp29-like protein